MDEYAQAGVADVANRQASIEAQIAMQRRAQNMLGQGGLSGPIEPEAVKTMQDIKVLDGLLCDIAGNVGQFIARALGDEGTACANAAQPREAFNPGFTGDIRRHIQDLTDRAAVLRDMSNKLGRIG